MKLTKSKLKQLIKEVFEDEDEPGISISPGNVQRKPTSDPVEDIIDEYSDRSVKPELIKRMLEVVRDFGGDLPLDEHDLNLIEDAAKEMKKHLDDETGGSEEEYEEEEEKSAPSTEYTSPSFRTARMQSGHFQGKN